VAVVANVVYLVLWLFFVALLIRLVFDFVQMFARSWEPRGIVLLLLEVIYSLTDPPLKALRRVIPPLRLGSVSLDLSFLVLIITVQIALSVVNGLR
jgi:YggT family protein